MANTLLSDIVAPSAIVTLTGTQTLTNKTLTSPTMTTPTLGVASATSIELGHATDTTLARVSAGVVSIEGVNVVTTSSTNTLTNKSISLATNTVTATLAELNTAISDADVASLAGSETLTNKTLTSPAINSATFKDGVVRGLEEDINVVASAATGTINFEFDTASIWYYTSNATANHTLNFRYSSSVSLNTALAVGDSITAVWLNTNGATAYYPSAITIDGNAVSPKVPSAITAGNASSIDAYSFTIIKTASATFTVLETQTKFA
jgi:hypothetical protein